MAAMRIMNMRKVPIAIHTSEGLKTLHPKESLVTMDPKSKFSRISGLLFSVVDRVMPDTEGAKIRFAKVRVTNHRRQHGGLLVSDGYNQVTLPPQTSAVLSNACPAILKKINGIEVEILDGTIVNDPHIVNPVDGGMPISPSVIGIPPIISPDIVKESLSFAAAMQQMKDAVMPEGKADAVMVEKVEKPDEFVVEIKKEERPGGEKTEYMWPNPKNLSPKSFVEYTGTVDFKFLRVMAQTYGITSNSKEKLVKRLLSKIYGFEGEISDL